MKIEVINVNDGPDGMNVDLELDREAELYLIRRGFNDLLREALGLLERKQNDEPMPMAIDDGENP